MKDYLVKDPWHIIEEGFHPDENRISESIFSIGNGHMGMRGNFEETFSGDSLQGSYMAGVYYPDKTIVGWWKNGYPEYFAKVLNSTNWIGLEILINGELVDLAKSRIVDFRRDLDMKQGLLNRSFTIVMLSGVKVKVNTSRFVSLANPELGALSYSLECPDKNVTVNLKSYLDGNIRNEDANYNELFWDPGAAEGNTDYLSVSMTTRKTGFTLGVCSEHKLIINSNPVSSDREIKKENHFKRGYASSSWELELEKGEILTLEKYALCRTTRDLSREELKSGGKDILNDIIKPGFSYLKKEHTIVWQEIWNHSDLVIDGEISAQQGIRFNIFQLNQTYSGKDARLNIGPKGFTGEKYGGSTYWDTEAYCLPFYLGTADSSIAKNLLLYRYNHLNKAIENGEKLGFKNGAALYPMVTMNGEECHNEWEITFEEIHRNGAIAYAIWNYINCTGDYDYLSGFGLEVLLAISRFWSQRATYSKYKKSWVILGVTGPNEYENNVSNNWYTNKIASWCLSYTLNSIHRIEENNSDEYRVIKSRLAITEQELELFRTISENMYFPENEELGIYLQQDGYLDKEYITVEDLAPEDRPLNQNWSWDRILRSCFIKQADVLQGLFFFENEFDIETIKRNFDFYEPRTVHESSLSSCVHSILACRLGYKEKAYEMYLRTARLDLDDYNNDTEDGCHITSMGGTWMSIVMGFGGLRYRETKMNLFPSIPEAWDSYSFKLFHQGSTLTIRINKEIIQVHNGGTETVQIMIYEKELGVKAESSVSLPIRT